MPRLKSNSPRSTSTRPSTHLPSLGLAVVVFVAGCAVLAFHLQTILGDSVAAGTVLSPMAWQGVIRWLGGSLSALDHGRRVADVPLITLFGGTAGLGLLTWGVGTLVIARMRSLSLPAAAGVLGFRGWLWWCLPAVWEVARTAAVLMGSIGLADQLLVILPFEMAVILAGWLATFGSLIINREGESASDQTIGPPDGPDAESAVNSFRVARTVWIACGLYAVIFTTMNWLLFWNLQVPHGDSSMYEEHLWNVLHGKGFRSYLDQGLFLGEHIQIVHLLLLPIYFFWPSHLLLELAQSLAVAACAIPVYWLARRHTGSEQAAICLACATLLYVPLQFLDIDIDLKTFRPITFGVTTLLFALDQIERRRWKSAAALLMVTLSAKEDYAIVLSLLGVWIFVDAWFPPDLRTKATAASARRTALRFGGGLAVLSGLYLLLATRVLMPWFRSGAEVHYASYFQKFGKSLDEIAINMLSNPQLLFAELFSTSTLLYALAMLVPLGCLPLFSPGRLAVAVPLFGVLCLNELARSPQHHFHAPLVPFVLWAAAAGFQRADRVWSRWQRNWPLLTASATSGGVGRVRFAPYFVLASALVTTIEFSLSPLGLVFWDSSGTWYWRNLYVIGERAQRFERIPPAIPKSSRVASTDFVHPRFTHYDRSYDYSNYRRRVSDYELHVPDDTDYIVIDCQHRYSEVSSPHEVREVQTEPDTWELVPELTDEYFIVLRRKGMRAADGRAESSGTSLSPPGAEG